MCSITRVRSGLCRGLGVFKGSGDLVSRPTRTSMGAASRCLTIVTLGPFTQISGLVGATPTLCLPVACADPRLSLV